MYAHQCRYRQPCSVFFFFFLYADVSGVPKRERETRVCDVKVQQPMGARSIQIHCCLLCTPTNAGTDSLVPFFVVCFVCRRQCGPQERLVYVMSKFKTSGGQLNTNPLLFAVYTHQCKYRPSCSFFFLPPLCFLLFVFVCRPQWGPQERFIYVTSKSNNEWGPTQYKSTVVCCVYPPNASRQQNHLVLFCLFVCSYADVNGVTTGDSFL